MQASNIYINTYVSWPLNNNFITDRLKFYNSVVRQIYESLFVVNKLDSNSISLNNSKCTGR